MANLNRDLVIQVDAKNSTLIGGNFKFFITDKHTSNFFVKLVINMSNNPMIQKYIALENASSYSTQLVAKKPNNEVLYVDGTLLDEQEALFLYDLTEEQLGVIGTYKCEFRIKSAVDDRVEVITTNPFTFEVLPSIVNDLDIPVDDVGLYPMYEEILARVITLEGGDVNGDINQIRYATMEYVDNAIESIDVTDQLDDYAKKTELPVVPTKLSEFDNDSKFISSIPAEYVTDSELNAKGYLTQHQSLADYATKAEIPTKVSELENDKGYLSSIPAEYVTDTELNDKGYLTEHQPLTNYATKDFVTSEIAKAQLEGEEVDLSVYATKEEIPTKVSELENDKNYLTSIPSEYVTDTELTAKGYLTSIPSEYVTDTELNAKGYLTSIPSEYVTKTYVDNKIADLEVIIAQLQSRIDEFENGDTGGDTGGDTDGETELDIQWTVGAVQSGTINTNSNDGVSSVELIVLDKDVKIYFDNSIGIKFKAYKYTPGGAYTGTSTEWYTSDTTIPADSTRAIRIEIRYEDNRVGVTVEEITKYIRVVKLDQ